MQEGGRPTKRQPSASKLAVTKRAPAPRQLVLPAHQGPLPSLSQLATESVGQELRILQKPNPSTRKPLRPRALPEESRRAALSAMDTAMPSLDDDSAQLIARARALIEEGGGASASSRGSTAIVPRRGSQPPPRRPASSTRLQTLPERISAAAGGGAAAAARIRAAPLSTQVLGEFARFGGGHARDFNRDLEAMQEVARERVRQARVDCQQREMEAEMEAEERQAGVQSRDAEKVDRFRGDVERRRAATPCTEAATPRNPTQPCATPCNPVQHGWWPHGSLHAW